MKHSIKYTVTDEFLEHTDSSLVISIVNTQLVTSLAATLMPTLTVTTSPTEGGFLHEAVLYTLTPSAFSSIMESLRTLRALGHGDPAIQNQITQIIQSLKI